MIWKNKPSIKHIQMAKKCNKLLQKNIYLHGIHFQKNDLMENGEE